MSGTLDDRYFEWLYGLVGEVRNRNPALTHWRLAKQLYTTEYVWLVPNDDNRVEDGKELRYEFLAEQETDEADQEWLDLGCSMLEMLVALARRASFEYDRMSPGDWFWLMLDNAGLAKYNDRRYTARIEREVDHILNGVIWRNYARNGEGGLFPLHSTHKDQRKVELWYQLSEYLLSEFNI